MRRRSHHTIARITEAYFPDLPKVRGEVIAGLLHQAGDKWTASVVSLQSKNLSIIPLLILSPCFETAKERLERHLRGCGKG